MVIKKYRDIDLLDIGGERLLAIACDSIGGIGQKEKDNLKVDLETVGFYSAQVVLMEILSIEAIPIYIANNLCVEMIDYGSKIIKGIKKALKDIKMGNIHLSGSTEENFQTVSTAFGITAIGILDKNKFLNRKRPMKGNVIIRIGKPKVGLEILRSNQKDILTAQKLLKIKKYIDFIELIPIGSKGFIYELKDYLKSQDKLNYILYKERLKDLEISSGPSTSALGIIRNKEHLKNIDKIINYEILGEII